MEEGERREAGGREGEGEGGRREGGREEGREGGRRERGREEGGREGVEILELWHPMWDEITPPPPLLYMYLQYPPPSDNSF